MLTNYQLAHMTSTHQCTEDIVDGVFSFDHIPNTVSKYPAFFICNNKPGNHPGEHWFSLFFPSERKQAELFCSLGKSPEYYGTKIINILTSNGNGHYKYNQSQLQGDSSRACAYFVLYFCDLRSRGFSYENIMNNFSPTDLEENEILVTTYTRIHMAQ